MIMGLIWETSFLAFAALTCLIGGGAAWMAGRGLALTWKPYIHVVFYTAVLGAAIRFLHFALFEGSLLAPSYYVADTAVLLTLATFGYRVTRTTQMVSQYRWLYRRSRPLSWSKR